MSHSLRPSYPGVADQLPEQKYICRLTTACEDVAILRKGDTSDCIGVAQEPRGKHIASGETFEAVHRCTEDDTHGL